MTRFALYAFFTALAAARSFGQSPDPAFSRIPFDEWFSQGDQSRIKWTARVSEPALSSHQRQVARVDVEIDGAELVRRRGKGQFLVLVQLNDENGRAWQNHQEIDLEHVEDVVRTQNIVVSQNYFVLPGDYNISIAVFASATAEHSVLKRKLHVPPLKNDPLPGAWRDLPAVELVVPEMPPDSWYLPAVKGKLRLTVETHEPVHVDLLVNLTPSERLAGSNQIQNRNLEALLPTTKVLSQVDWGETTLNLAWLDLSRRRITYQQDNIRQDNIRQDNIRQDNIRQDNMHGLDWAKAAGTLAELNPGMIDVKALENRQHTAQFFLDEVQRRIAATKGATPRRTPVVIILSSAVRFETAQELHPLASEGAADAHVFYIRYQPPPRISLAPAAPQLGRQRRRMQDGAPLVRTDSEVQSDQLEHLLKPLDPQLFEVTTAEQFRKALATILADIAKL